jgi:hypothetical protein
MPATRFTSILRTIMFWLARGLAALVVGTGAGMFFLGVYWALDPSTRQAGLGLTIFFPMATAIALPLTMAVGVLPMFFIAGILEWAFSLPKKRHEHIRIAAAAVLGSVFGYLLLLSSLSVWGDPVPGALFGCTIMVAWCVVEQPMRAFLLTAPIRRRK